MLARDYESRVEQCRLQNVLARGQQARLRAETDAVMLMAEIHVHLDEMCELGKDARNPFLRKHAEAERLAAKSLIAQLQSATFNLF